LLDLSLSTELSLEFRILNMIKSIANRFLLK